MPDHLHLFCAPATEGFSVYAWSKYWKSVASRAWPVSADLPLWQPYIWDTQLRSGDSYDAKWDYVRNNPVRRGLTAKADDWPYQGELHDLWWHDR